MKEAYVNRKFVVISILFAISNFLPLPLYADSAFENEYGYYLGWCNNENRILEYILGFSGDPVELKDTFGLISQSEYEMHWIGKSSFCKLYYSNQNKRLCLDKSKSYWEKIYNDQPLLQRKSLAYKIGFMISGFVTNPAIIGKQYESVASFTSILMKELEKNNMLTACHYLILGFIRGLRENIHIENSEPILEYSFKYDSDNDDIEKDYLKNIRKEIQLVNKWITNYQVSKNVSDNQEPSIYQSIFPNECEPLNVQSKSGLMIISNSMNEMKTQLETIKSDIDSCISRAKSLSNADIQNSVDDDIRKLGTELEEKANRFGNDGLDQARCIEENVNAALVEIDLNEDFYAEILILKKQFLVEVLGCWLEIRNTASSGYPLSHEAKKVNRILDEKILNFVSDPKTNNKRQQ